MYIYKIYKNGIMIFRLFRGTRGNAKSVFPDEQVSLRQAAPAPVLDEQPSSRLIIILAVLGIALGYAAYHRALVVFRKILEDGLARLALEEEKNNLPKNLETLDRKRAGRFVRALEQTRFLKGFWQSGLLLGSLLAGSSTFERAVNLIALPRIKRVVVAITPIFENVMGPLLRGSANLGIGVATRIARVLVFFGSVGAFANLFMTFGGPAVADNIVPFLDTMVRLVEGFFETPKSVSVASGFLEKTLKVVCATFCFGGFVSRAVFCIEKDDVKIHYWIGCFLWGTSLIVILRDHKFIAVFAQNMVQSFPPIGNAASHPFGQICLLFGSGVLIRSGGTPPIVTFFYGWLLYLSGLYGIVLSTKFPRRSS